MGACVYYCICNYVRACVVVVHATPRCGHKKRAMHLSSHRPFFATPLNRTKKRERQRNVAPPYACYLAKHDASITSNIAYMNTPINARMFIRPYFFALRCGVPLGSFFVSSLVSSFAPVLSLIRFCKSTMLLSPGGSCPTTDLPLLLMPRRFSQVL